MMESKRISVPSTIYGLSYEADSGGWKRDRAGKKKIS